LQRCFYFIRVMNVFTKEGETKLKGFVRKNDFNSKTSDASTAFVSEVA
jgi:hypothetical protein